MKNEDDLVFLNPLENSGNDFLMRYEEQEDTLDLMSIEGDQAEVDTDLETTIEVTRNSKPYWQRIFG